MKQMYKVFLNDRLIKIGAPEKITLNKPCVDFDGSGTTEAIYTWFNSFIESELPEVFLFHSDPDLFFRLFQSVFIPVNAAGGVVVSGERLLFIFRRGKWDLPKGKLDAGETPEDAAIREVGEETGTAGHRIVKPLPSTFHIYESPYPESKGQWIFKQTFWFEMNCDGEPNGKPQQEEGITQVKWVQKNALNDILANTYENLKQIILLYRD